MHKICLISLSYYFGMINNSKQIEKQKLPIGTSDPVFRLVELLIKIDQREKIIPKKKEENNEDRRNSDNTSKSERWFSSVR